MKLVTRLRDKYDDMARIFRGYADSTRFNETLFNGLLNYSKSCTLLADTKDMTVQRIQSKVQIINISTKIIFDEKKFHFNLNYRPCEIWRAMNMYARMHERR